jgi:type II secretory pathway component GspD/PulD (secretin)
LLVSENFLEDIGLETNITKLRIGGGFTSPLSETGNISIAQNSAAHTATTATNVPGSLGDIVSASGAALASTINYESLDDLQVEFILRATQAHSNAKQLQAPKVMVLNGESATMQVTTSKALKTGSQFNTDTVTNANTTTQVYWWESENEDITTGIQLTISPVLTADKKFVVLRVITYLQELISQDTEQAVGFTPQGTEITDNYILPTTQMASVQTRVAVPDRGTLMLGGLTVTANKELESGVPVLSKIPGLGRFFSNRSIVDDKQMLLILVKPTILLQNEQEADAIGALSSR